MIFANYLINIMRNKYFPKSKKSHNRPGLTYSEMMTIVLFYHLSGMKCFQYYYQYFVCTHLKSHFPHVVSYSRFIQLIPYLCCFQLYRQESHRKGVYYIDSKKLPVCHNLRIHSHKVFNTIARREKSSTGWFYGLKLFLVINHCGEVVRLFVTKGNMSDNNLEFILKSLSGLKGLVFGDRGFISSQLFEKLYCQGLKLVTGIRNNMKNKLFSTQEKLLLKKRGVIESVFDILTTVCDLEHTRHRSPANALSIY